MYLPPSNAEYRPEVMHDFIEAHPLGALVTSSADGLFATHLPLVLDRAGGPHGTPDAGLLVAELDGAGPAGVAHAHTAADYFAGERHGHLSILAVAAAGEGKGVGRALLAAVEAWSGAQGHRFLTLNVFAGNDRARAVHECAGYGHDTLRYVKVLGDASVSAAGPSAA